MQLCIDIGNTRTKWGIFRERELVAHDAPDTFTADTLYHICQKWPVERAIYAYVKTPGFDVEKTLEAHCPVLAFSHDTPLPFTNLYATPDTLGRDRLALVAGARAHFPENNVLVVSAGTCITYDYITSRSEYLGGSIHPGIQMRLKAMHQFTGKLPLTEAEIPGNITGNSTVSSLQVGAVLGTAKETDGMIAGYFKQYGELKVVISGGDVTLLVAMLENEIFAIPLLSLVGLNEILLYNAAIR